MDRFQDSTPNADDASFKVPLGVISGSSIPSSVIPIVVGNLHVSLRHIS